MVLSSGTGVTKPKTLYDIYVYKVFDQAAEQSLTEVESPDCPIREEEVVRVIIRNLKSRKPCGSDGTVAKMLKSADPL